MGVEVIDTYIEPGNTATQLDKRPVFRALLTRIETRRDVDWIIVHSLSRFIRNWVESGVVLSSLRQFGVSVASATENIDGSLEGHLLHGILNVINDYRSRSDGRDISYKMGQKALMGGTISRAGIGYRNVGELYEDREVRTVVVDKERAPLIALGFQLYATGEYSVVRLAKKLEALGLRHRATAHVPAHPVSRQQLFRILRNRYYCGYVLYQGVWRKGRHEAIISEELFRRVQTVLKEHGAGERQRVHNHYLKGLFWCGSCKHRMIYMKAKNRHGQDYSYYFCRGRQEGVCSRPFIAADKLENVTLVGYGTLDLPRSDAEEIGADLDRALDRRINGSTELREHLSKLLGDLDQRESNFLDLAGEGVVPKEKLRAKLEAVRTERDQYERELRQLADEWKLGADTILLALELLDNIQAVYRDAGTRLRRRLNQTFWSKIFIEGEDIVAAELAEPFDGIAYYRRRRSSLQLQYADSAIPKEGVFAGSVFDIDKTRPDFPAPIFLGEGLSKMTMVQLLMRYSRSPEIYERLLAVRKLIQPE